MTRDSMWKKIGELEDENLALAARLADAELVINQIESAAPSFGDVEAWREHVLRVLRGYRGTDSADIVTVRTSWKEREVARLIRDHQKIIDTKRKSCPRCYGTGAIDAPTSADDPSCPDCDGEGHV